jgi:hypothetical protein
MKKSLLQDLESPPVDDPGTVRCNTCGWDSLQASFEGDSCPKCGKLFRSGQLEKIFQHGVNDQSIMEFENMLKQVGLSEEHVREVSETLKKAIPTTTPEPAEPAEEPFKPEVPTTEETIKDVLQPGKALEPLERVTSRIRAEDALRKEKAGPGHILTRDDLEKFALGLCDDDYDEYRDQLEDAIEILMDHGVDPDTAREEAENMLHLGFFDEDLDEF